MGRVPDSSIIMLPLEEDIVAGVRGVVHKHETRLRAAGLTCAEPVVSIHSMGSERTSEIRLEMFRNGQLDDVFEFLVFRDGKILVTVEEVVQWLERQLEAVQS